MIATKNRPKRDVLAVDDNVHFLRSLVRQLHQHCALTIATSAVEGIALLEQQHFDVILSDYQMPDFGGDWLLTSVKQRHPSVRRILHTCADPALMKNLLATGIAHEVLDKPATLDQLLLAIGQTPAD